MDGYLKIERTQLIEDLKHIGFTEVRAKMLIGTYGLTSVKQIYHKVKQAWIRDKAGFIEKTLEKESIRVKDIPKHAHVKGLGDLEREFCRFMILMHKLPVCEEIREIGLDKLMQIISYLDLTGKSKTREQINRLKDRDLVSLTLKYIDDWIAHDPENPYPKTLKRYYKAHLQSREYPKENGFNLGQRISRNSREKVQV